MLCVSVAVILTATWDLTWSQCFMSTLNRLIDCSHQRAADKAQCACLNVHYTPVLLFPVVSIFASSPLATLPPSVMLSGFLNVTKCTSTSSSPPSIPNADESSLRSPFSCLSFVPPSLPPFLLPGSQQPRCNRLPSPSLGAPL